MKRILFLAAAALFAAGLSAQSIRYVDASAMTIIGKPLPVENPYARVDTLKYGFNSRGIRRFCSYSTGLAVVFETDSRTIRARWTTSGKGSGENMPATAQKGLDLYILRDGEWVFAGVGKPDMSGNLVNHESKIVADMEPGAKKCLLYLPLFDKVDRLEIGVDFESYIKSSDNPFRHKIVFNGSSITHGAAAGRAGMSYVARFGRDNGFDCCNMGFAGMMKLQKEYAQYLADVEADAFVFDAFSNPNAKEIHERFDKFVDILRVAHPDTPLIFLQTERRETRNFSTAKEKYEAAKQKAAEEEVRDRMRVDRHIYFITSEDFLGHDHVATADGTHPTDLGFTRMLESISPDLLKILRRYGIK